MYILGNKVSLDFSPKSGADPGFPVGGGANLPTQALFGENICKNERIWSCWGGAHRKLLYVDPPLKVNSVVSSQFTKLLLACMSLWPNGYTLADLHTKVSGPCPCAPPPPRDPILLFSQTFSPKSTCIGDIRPLPPEWVHAPPTGNPGSAPALH